MRTSTAVLLIAAWLVAPTHAGAQELSLEDVPARLEKELADFGQEARKVGLEPQ